MEKISLLTSNSKVRDWKAVAAEIAESLYSDVVHSSENEVISGAKTFSQGPYGTASALEGSSIDLSNGTVFTKTISAATAFTFTGVPSGKAACFTLILTNGGSASVTWPESVNWVGGSPNLSASGTDILTFITPDGGTTWYSSNPSSSGSGSGSGSSSSVSVYQGATASAAGVAGLVPAAQSAEKDYFLKGDGTWAEAGSSSIDETDIVHITGEETITGAKTFGNVWNTASALNGTSGEVYIAGDASVYSLTISTHTNIYFPTVASGKSKVFTVIIAYDTESSNVVYWPASTYWASGTAPILYALNVITFLGVNDGTSTKWFGTVSIANASTEV